MDQLAVSGFDVYAVDVRGYGASTSPVGMGEAVDPRTQPVRIETAIRDLGRAIDHILEYRRLDQLNLVAMSWGGSVAGAYTAKNNGKIKRLALIAPLCLRDTPGRIDQGGDSGDRSTWNRCKYYPGAFGRNTGYSRILGCRQAVL